MVIHVPQKYLRAGCARAARGAGGRSSSTKSISVSAHCTEANLDHYLDSLERQRITGALAQTRANKTGAARFLGITLRALRQWGHGGGFPLDAPGRIEARDRKGARASVRYCSRPIDAQG
jgi:hypothetical protein